MSILTNRSRPVICIWVLDQKTGEYYRASCRSVTNILRSMQPGEAVLYPFLETDAVRAACSNLRTKEGINVCCSVLYRGMGKFMKVERL